MGDESNQTDEHQVELSEDARIVEIVTADLQRAGVTGDIFSTVQQHGYLLEWTQDRWMNAELELTQGRLLGRRQMIECS